MNDLKTTVVILEFAKYPQPGHVKTRLAASLGFEEACRIYDAMAQKTHHELLKLQGQGEARVIVYADGADRQKISGWLRGAYDIWLQPDGDIGARLEYAFCKAFEMGFQTVMAVGTDCPGLTAEKIQEAVGQMKRFDVVIVPATDGGYVLIGTNAFQPDLFRQITWSSNQTLEQTLQRAKAKNMSVALLGPETDVDTVEDLKMVEDTLNPQLSVIIPVLNDRHLLKETLHAFSCVHHLGEIEVIVVDGGSTDGSGDVAAGFNAKVLKSAPGRSRQMSLGVRHARGRWFWFLHADCVPELETIRSLPGYLRTVDLRWGFFKQRISDPSPSFRLIELGNKLRGRIFNLPYGDQGIMVRRDLYFQCGGYAQVPFLEDAILSRCLSKTCRPTVINKTIKITSRHWKPLGPFFTTIRNINIAFRFLVFRQSPADLLEYYLKWEKR
ncbi:MAG TPA: TIGR04282 family arsenosugar biosynthesis glycosyltransferase [Candidatus Brocadiaceae bacterium]|nr:TIGR04282 family arsenosugar biosynthesis glycosyltransferase [Candidatus Brocadiaceae bacterium]